MHLTLLLTVIQHTLLINDMSTVVIRDHRSGDVVVLKDVGVIGTELGEFDNRENDNHDK